MSTIRYPLTKYVVASYYIKLFIEVEFWFSISMQTQCKVRNCLETKSIFVQDQISQKPIYIFQKK